MKQLFSKFLVAFLLTSAVVLSWSEYFFITNVAIEFKYEKNHAHLMIRIVDRLCLQKWYPDNFVQFLKEKIRDKNTQTS